jgi:hypothetical protein
MLPPALMQSQTKDLEDEREARRRLQEMCDQLEKQSEILHGRLARAEMDVEKMRGLCAARAKEMKVMADRLQEVSSPIEAHWTYIYVIYIHVFTTLYFR